MRLSAPSKLFFLISLALFILGLVAANSTFGFPYDGYAVTIAYVVLAIGCLFRGV